MRWLFSRLDVNLITSEVDTKDVSLEQDYWLICPLLNNAAACRSCSSLMVSTKRTNTYIKYKRRKTVRQNTKQRKNKHSLKITTTKISAHSIAILICQSKQNGKATMFSSFSFLRIRFCSALQIFERYIYFLLFPIIDPFLTPNSFQSITMS